jgi:hypothetical protein
MATSKKSARVIISHVALDTWKKANKIKALSFMTTKGARCIATIGEIRVVTAEGFDQSLDAYIMADQSDANLFWIYNIHQSTVAFTM